MHFIENVADSYLVQRTKSREKRKNHPRLLNILNPQHKAVPEGEMMVLSARVFERLQMKYSSESRARFVPAVVIFANRGH